MRALKRGLAILLLPATVGVTLALVELASLLFHGPVASGTPASLAFAIGYSLWLLIFVLLPKPTRTYVLGHELTHAFWALLMGAHISGLKVRKTGGEVRTSKVNWFITLVPYFFPFYAMLFLALFLVAHAIWDLTAHLWLLFFLVGLGWSFHVTFTLMLLFSTAQPDLKQEGLLFSIVVIYLMNLLVIAVTATSLSDVLTFRELASNLGHHLLKAYGWTLDILRALWQHLLHAIRH